MQATIGSVLGTISAVSAAVLDSRFRGILLAVVTIIALLIIRGIMTRAVRAYIYRHAYKPENADSFMATWKYVWTAVIAIFGVISLSGSMKTLGISAGFLGMVMGWSLQAPITGIAAWIMLIVKRPFRIGQRVIIAGVIGDVMDITLTHVVLNQVGGTVAGEEPSGRGILIPTAILFSQTITNYTYDVDYILDEVPVRVTFESDWDVAESILIAAASEVMASTIQETKEEPFLRAELFDAGVLLRLRYKTRPADRQENSSLIVKRIFHEFAKSGQVEFAYAHSEVLYRWKDAEQSGARGIAS